MNDKGSTRRLILTGWGTHDYGCAAALAFRYHAGIAVASSAVKRAGGGNKNASGGVIDIRGMSIRKLPDFLNSGAASGYDEIIILGIGSSQQPELHAPLAVGLAKLRAEGTQITWISAMNFEKGFVAAVRAKCKIAIDLNGGATAESCGSGSVLAVIDCDSLTDAAGAFYECECADIARILSGESKPPEWVANCRMLLDDARFAHSNYHDDGDYGAAIRRIAENPRRRLDDVESRKVLHCKRFGRRELVGDSECVAALRGKIDALAERVRARVMICGETGTGKETVAALIHNKSPRKGEPFVAFNCASVVPALLESSFLGHAKGAFTGAHEDKKGVFEQANGGTLFLDEIGELPLEAQGVLLRALEEGRFLPVGGAEEVSVDVRLIVATNKNLPEMVRDKKFREDLFYRLNVAWVSVPPLREHAEDIGKIANSYWRAWHGGETLAKEQIKALEQHDYPGNVRELFNLLERASALGEEDFSKLIAEHKQLMSGFERSAAAPSAAPAINERVAASAAPECTERAASKHPSASAQEHPSETDFPDNLEAMTRLHVRRVFEKHNRNLTQTAAALGAARNTVRKYLEESL